MKNLLKNTVAPLTLALVLTPAAHAQTDVTPRPKTSFAAESDVLSYGIDGYSGIVNVSLGNRMQAAFGTGRYEVPSFLLKGEDNFEAAKWKATATSVQVLRVTYRFNGPRRNGPALGVVALNQNWTLGSQTLGGSTRFKQLNTGITGGYYLHLGKHLYLYPTAAFTLNHVYSGSTAVRGTSYEVEKFAPNASLHMGWEF